MNQDTNRTYAPPNSELLGADAYSSDRSEFIVRTYNHLAGAIIGFCAIEILLFTSGIAETLASAMLSTSWLLVLGAFMVVAWIATHFAHSAESQGAQYAALMAYVVAEALIFVPLLYIADMYAPGAIQSAVLVTAAATGGLTLIAFTTRKDFSFMGAFLKWIGLMALVLIGAALVFGFNLGVYFSVAMVAFAGAAILYDTSNIIHHYPEDRYVGAALQLFASIALMLWYVLRLFMSRE